MNENLVFSYGTLACKFQQEFVPAVLINNYRMSNYGQYPALVNDIEEHQIPGQLLSLTDLEFKEADYYEGYPDLYDRKKMQVNADCESIQAWVYILQKGKQDE